MKTIVELHTEMLVQAMEYKSANKVSDENLSPPYHFNRLCIQPNTGGLAIENTLIIVKTP